MKEKFDSHKDFTDQELDPANIFVESVIKGRIGYCADFISKATYERLFDRLPVHGTKMLDIGAGAMPLVQVRGGAGTYLEALEDRGATVIPVERRTLPIHTWKPMRGETEPFGETRAMPVQADANALPFKAASVEGAISVNYINSFEKKAKESVKNFLQEVYRTLKPKGFLIISTFGYTCSISSKGEMTVNNRIPFNEFVTAKMVKELAAEVGFTSSEDIPLDKQDIDRSRAKWLEDDQRQGKDVTGILMEEPIGLLLRK